MATRKKRLLIAVAGLGIGGAEVVIKHLVHSIDRSKFDVSVCCIKVRGPIGDELARSGVNVVTLADSDEARPTYLTFIKLFRLIRKERIDVVHTHTTDALADAAICRLLIPSLRLIHTFHFGNYPNADRSNLRIERLFARFADKLVAVGDVQRRQIISTFGLRDGDVDKVWNGIPIEPAVASGRFRASVGANDRILVGTIATLIPQKGLTDLMEVARRLRNVNRKVMFVIIGDGALRSELEELRVRLGLEDTVVLAGWVKDASRVGLPDFDVFFQPSLWEAMSIAVLEAMAAEKAIVATRVGENPHLIDDGSDGLLVAPRNIEQMVAALCSVCADEELRDRLGRAAGAKARHQFTVDHMARHYEQLYLDAMAN
jgi:glycosyltransferase involved in cell wall biosynthesis